MHRNRLFIGNLVSLCFFGGVGADTEFVNVTVLNILLEGVTFVLCYGHFSGLYLLCFGYKIDCTCLTIHILCRMTCFASHIVKTFFFKCQVI